MLDYLCVSFLLRKVHVELILCLKLFCNLLQLVMELLDLRRGILNVLSADDELKVVSVNVICLSARNMLEV